MAGINKVILIGNLGKDPEVKYLEGGVAVARFSLATTETYKDKNGAKKDQTEWHNIVVWRGLAEVAEKFLKKGDTVYIEGKIRSRSYEDKDGTKKYSTDIVAENLTMLGGKREPLLQEQANNPSSVSTPAVSNSGLDDDLPF